MRTSDSRKNIEYILVYARDKDGDGGFQKFNEVYDEEDLFDVIEDMRATGKSWKYTRVFNKYWPETIPEKQYRTELVTQLRYMSTLES